MLSKNKIKFFQSLTQKKNRDELGLFVAEGEKIIREILPSTIKIRTLIGTDELLQHFSYLSIDSISASIDDIKKISSLKTPQGIIAICEIPTHQFVISGLKHELTLCLDGIQDPGNLGTIIRLASWFGIKHIVCSLQTVDCYNPKVIQSTMGAISKVMVHYVDLPLFIKNCISNDIPVYGTFMQGANIYTTNLSKDGIILMGNEGQGISKELENIINQRITIPNYSDGLSVESLNVSIATSIVLAEFRRRLI